MAEWLESALCNTRVPTSNPALVALQKSNMFEITLVAEDQSNDDVMNYDSLTTLAY